MTRGTMQSVTWTKNGERPSRMTGTSSLRSSRRYCLRKCKIVRLPKKKAKIQTALTAWLQIVASAAPLHPISRP